MCGQAEMIAAFIVLPVLLPVDGGVKAVPHYELESFAFHFSAPSMTNTVDLSVHLSLSNHLA